MYTDQKQNMIDLEYTQYPQRTNLTFEYIQSVVGNKFKLRNDVTK